MRTIWKYIKCQCFCSGIVMENTEDSTMFIQRLCGQIYENKKNTIIKLTLNIVLTYTWIISSSLSSKDFTSIAGKETIGSKWISGFAGGSCA